MAEPFVLGRGKDFCRGCNGADLFSALNLGDLPIANELWSDEGESPEIFPLHLRICNECGLGQVEDVVTPTRLFRDYRYLSSISTSFTEHARRFVLSIIESNLIKNEDWVLEIASNDGYLLRHFIDNGIRVLGVEPAENVARIASDDGIPTINEFFGENLAESISKKMGHPKLIIANNVMAHVPDLQDFVAGLAQIAGPETIISIENPSLLNLTENNQFDTIYHEHFSYLTAHSVAKIVDAFGLELFDLEKISTHGGSHRYWLRQKIANKLPNNHVQVIVESELKAGLFDQRLWSEFSLRIQSLLISFHDWLKFSFDRGDTVCGYGAAAKASTLINAAKIEKSWIAVIADASPEKQGRYMPIHGIPIVSPQEMFALKPSDVVIFPWNITEELAIQIRQESKTPVRLWQAIPTLTRIS